MSEPADPDPVRALWEASSRRLRGWFERRTGSRHDADDLVQETFLRVQAKLPSLRDGERLDAWVGAIAANALADHGRRRSREPAPPGDARAGPPPERAAPPADEEDLELRRAVASWADAFLDRLARDDAALLRAVDMEGRAQVDIARELGIAPSSARSRVQRARTRLGDHLEACCKFAFDARGNLTDAVRRAGASCECDAPGEEPRC